MIIVRKTSVIIFTTAAAVFFTVLAFISYYYISQAYLFTYDMLKFYSERIFLAGLAGGVFFFVTGAGFIINSRRFGKALDKLLVMSRNSGYSPDAGLRKLGKIGIQIADILSEMNRIGEMRALRISSLHNLCEIIMKTSDRAAAVVTSSGEIRYCSKSFAKKYSQDPENMIDHMIDVYVKDRDIMEMIEGAVISRKEISMVDGVIHPVVNSINEVIFCFCIFNSTSVGISLTSIKESSAYKNIVEKGGRIKKIINFMKTIKK